eukprot:TRINITY_DN8129_c0_g1_i1.p1 TRINITY_DN8129_c0_g1~~TRINITY_DN8129_c0_g1_i1.p1  ORF type:complete len:830 (-),score=186.95 TRINITY_DN8129_c0_g1_i1:102-2558(-)
MGNSYTSQTTTERLLDLFHSDEKTVRKTFKKLFNEYDQDHTGYINQKEASQFISDFLELEGMEGNRDIAKISAMVVFKMVDRNGDNRLDEGEFLDAVLNIDEILGQVRYEMELLKKRRMKKVDEMKGRNREGREKERKVKSARLGDGVSKRKEGGGRLKSGGDRRDGRVKSARLDHRSGAKSGREGNRKSSRDRKSGRVKSGRDRNKKSVRAKSARLDYRNGAKSGRGGNRKSPKDRKSSRAKSSRDRNKKSARAKSGRERDVNENTVNGLKGEDGYYHPETEEDIVKIVQYAHDHSYQVRVRGSGHSNADHVYTDHVGQNLEGWRFVNPIPPDTPESEMNILLDKYCKIISVDTDNLIAVVQGGIHLGEDPESNPPVPYSDSLLYQLHEDYGLSVDDTGGITHQTLAGFLSTGSSGGSLKHSIDPNVIEIRIVGIVDGKATPIDYTLESEEYPYQAAVVSVGLLGVVSEVKLKLSTTFRIDGEETSRKPEHAEFDIFDQDSLESFFRKEDYSRAMWWPQNNDNRLVTWKSTRLDGDVPEGYTPRPYEEFNNRVEPALLKAFLSLMGGIMYGSIIDLSKKEIEDLKEVLEMKQEEFKLIQRPILSLLIKGLIKAADSAVLLSNFISRHIDSLRPLVPPLMQIVIDMGQATGPEHDIRFTDWGYHGLPMDNTAPDDLLPYWFSEIWVPIADGARTIRTLSEYFNAADDYVEMMYRTGLFSWEIYCTPPNENWMHMAYSNGQDIWKDGCLRIDMLWYGFNEGNPRDFYTQHWNHLREQGLTFRLHWGKYWPDLMDHSNGWLDYFRDKWERGDDFLALKEK